LREFFGLTRDEVRLVVTESIEKDDWLKEIFKISISYIFLPWLNYVREIKH